MQQYYRANVLVTGASTGIGRSTAELLAAKGYLVFAGARRAEDLDALGRIQGIVALKLDVTAEADIVSAVAVIRDAGGLDVLINNAGIAVAGAMVEVRTDELRRQFETNVFGVQRLTQEAFPLLLEKKGRIVNISSVAGHIALPFIGCYAMSKFALEGYSDALRRELAPLGVAVVTMEVGSVKTPIWEKFDPKQMMGSRFRERMERLYRFKMKLAAGGLEASYAAGKIVKVVSAGKPKGRYLVTEANFGVRVIKSLPRFVLDRLLSLAKVL